MKHRVLCITLLALACLLLALVACGEDTSPADTSALTGSSSPTETAPETDAPTEVETVIPTETEALTAPVTDPETETEAETFEIYEEVFGQVRVQLYSDSVLRIEEAEDGTFCDGTTIAVTNRTRWPGVPVERIVEENGDVLLVTPRYTVTIPSGATAAQDVRVRDSEGTVLWSPRKTSTAVTSLPEPYDTPACWAFNDCPRVTVPANGFTEVSGAADNGFIYETQTNDYYLLVCEQDAFRLRSDYNQLVGQCDMVTVKALGLWFSRFYAYNDRGLYQVVRQFRSHGYPIDYVVVDTDWRIGSSTGYEINTSLFPDMAKFLQTMHSLNVNIAFNDHVRDSADSLLSATQLEWFNQNLTEKLELGLDTWWYDRNWHYALKSPFANIHGDMLGQMMYQSIMQVYNAPLNRRTVMLSNYYTDVHSRLTLPNYIGTHRYSIQWTGDITPAVLPNELANLVQMSTLTSTAYISSDIGGHLYSPSDEMYIRWTQYGALSPIMRYHSSGADRSPWAHGEAADQVANTYINMRYRLLPLFYSLAHENYADGMPIARRLDFYYPQYEEARASDQYLLGEDILVAPITEGERPPDSSWLKAPDGTEGVEITYYNNKNLQGKPVRSEHASTIDFNWGTGSPCSGVGADNFSAIVRTTLTVGSSDIRLGTISDDGVRVYVNDQLVIDFWQASDSTMVMNKDFVLKANTSYDVRVEYYEESGGASLRLLCISSDLSTTTYRTVFIPDGQWMDVFSGTVYEGPQTVTVTHGLATSPIFVRLGSLTALAYKSEYADTAQWERLVLDVYPAEGTSDTSTLYEDDGASLDYQSGGCRETALTLSTANGKTAVRIGAAKGGYTTDWVEREWTLRIHASDVTSVTVNGESVAFTVIQKDSTAAPFAAEGGSPDGDVVTITFNAAVNRATEIVIE